MDAFDQRDVTGAHALHALIVCNTPESLELAMEMYAMHAPLLPLVHVMPRSTLAGTTFIGESSLHILAANRHEEEFVTLVGVSSADLEPWGLCMRSCKPAFFLRLHLKFMRPHAQCLPLKLTRPHARCLPLKCTRPHGLCAIDVYRSAHSGGSSPVGCFLQGTHERCSVPRRRELSSTTCQCFSMVGSPYPTSPHPTSPHLTSPHPTSPHLTPPHPPCCRWDRPLVRDLV